MAENSNLAPRKVPLSRARWAGSLLFISGQLPRIPGGGMRDGPLGGQTEQAIANLRTVLGEHGLGLEHVVKTTVWLTSAEHLDGMNKVYTDGFPEPYPTRSTVVSGLVAPADIEIEAVAYDPQRSPSS